MSAAQYDLSISCGEDFTFTLRVIDPFDDPIDFTNSTFIAEIREEHKKPLIASFSITDEDDGTLRFLLPSDKTKVISPSKQYKWDFFWTKNGITTKLLYGNVSSIAHISNV